MHTHRQGFWNPFPAARAILRGVAWINLYQRPTSLRSFVGRVLDELAPRRIVNALGQRMVLDHVGRLQVFKDQYLEALYKTMAQLVGKILAPVGDPRMDMLDYPIGFAPLRAAFREATGVALCLRQRLLVLAEEARVGDLLTLASRQPQGSEVVQTQVDADYQGRGWQGLRFYLDREAGVPMVQAIAWCRLSRAMVTP